MKNIILGISLLLLLLLNACSAETEKSVNDAATNLKDHVSNVLDKDEPHVLSVTKGHLQNHPDVSLEDAFKEFFGDPTWKYFKATSGNDIVEFTGFMTYQEAKVKARIQFILKENESFEIGALSFNDVPQNELIKATLLSSVFDKDKDKTEHNKKVNQKDNPTIQRSEDATDNAEASEAPTKPIAAPPEPTSTPSPKATNTPLPNSLYGGKISGIASGIGDSTITLFDLNGKLDKQIDTGTGFAFVFPNVVYYTTSRMSLNGNMREGEVTAMRFLKGHSILGVKIGETPQEIIDKLGQPNESGLDNLDGGYSMTYTFGDYNLYIIAPDKDSPTIEALYKIN